MTSLVLRHGEKVVCRFPVGEGGDDSASLRIRAAKAANGNSYFLVAFGDATKSFFFPASKPLTFIMEEE